jgi:hydrogenase/urease accessory protein HupE
MTRILQGLFLLAVPASALAHELTTEYGAFLGSALHIFTEIDHLAAFAVLGLLAGQSEAFARVSGVVAFSVVLVLGMVAPLALAGVGSFESAEALLSPATVLMVGILVAAGMRLPGWATALAGAATGMVHGIANGLAIAASPQPGVVPVLGGITAACVITVVALLVAGALNGPRGRIVVRVVGSWVAALGLMMMGLALRG